MRKLKTLVILLGFAISTACLGQSAFEDRICLFPEEMDYFLRQDARAKYLSKDSAEYVGIIGEQNQQIQLLQANQNDLKSMVGNSNMIAENYKKDLLDVRGKLSTSEGRLKRRTGILIGSITVNIAFIGAVVLVLK